MNWVCQRCYAALQAAEYKDREILTLGNQLRARCVYCGVIDKSAYCLTHAPMPPPFEVMKAGPENKEAPVSKIEEWGWPEPPLAEMSIEFVWLAGHGFAPIVRTITRLTPPAAGVK